MIMHIWMHWFWITTSYLKGFLFFAAQTISFSCISHPLLAEAGLLENRTFTSIPSEYYGGKDSSQLEDGDRGVPSPAVVEGGNSPPETTPHRLTAPREETLPEESTTPETGPKTALSHVGDVEDAYNGGNIDVFQFPLKKFVKFSHLKYGKAKAKGKPNDERGGEEQKPEGPKEESIGVISSATVDGSGHSEVEVDESGDGPSEGGTSALPTSSAPDTTTTAAAAAAFALESATTRAEGQDNASGGEPDAPSSFPFERASSPADARTKDLQIPKNDTLTIENKVEEGGGGGTTAEPSAVKNRVAASTSAQNYDVQHSELNVGSITGITLGILVIFTLFGAVSFVLYRRRYLNKPQVLHDKCSNLDSSGYIDETSLRENSEEMYSLDNDSFLNSLEAMTIQNYWTESVKHTKL